MCLQILAQISHADFYFGKSHIKRANESIRYNILLSQFDDDGMILYSLNPEKSYEVIALNLPLEEELEDGMEVRGSCKGILCLSNDAHAVYLWNPSSTECVKLPDKSFDIIANLLRPLAFGFGHPATTVQSKLINGKLYAVQKLQIPVYPEVGLSENGDIPITEGSWPLPKLVEIFRKNLYQDEDFFNRMKIGGQGNYLSLVELANFSAGKLEMYNDSIHNARPAGQKKKAMSALSVARTYMIYVLGTFLLPVKNGSSVTAWYLYFFEKDKANIKWSWGSAVLADLFQNLGEASRTDGKQFAAYTTLLVLPGIPEQQHSDAAEYCTRWKWGLSITDWTGAYDLLKYRDAFDNYKVVWDPYRAKIRSDHNFNENAFFNGLTSS
ncbi:hypothetical protein GIB67_040637 [Kingdonia uniflora]|uniref:Aminotransferase-like plant mobile domain-containing protein n=1 Tax=Kingdonia uniflora TaxID=39325 RepID=A0A7J7M9B2_9MAGN|nr:hypothetical protein GIB67_040637 [Kingdonia uniflora]